MKYNLYIIFFFLLQHCSLIIYFSLKFVQHIYFISQSYVINDNETLFFTLCYPLSKPCNDKYLYGFIFNNNSEECIELGNQNIFEKNHFKFISIFFVPIKKNYY